MGARSSKAREEKAVPVARTDTVVQMQDDIQTGISLPLEVQVAHFTPSSFPLVPIISARTSSLCEDSWSKIVANEIEDQYGGKISGMTVFYDEFYHRLEQFDSKGQFEAVLSRHAASGSSKIAAKGAILVRIVRYVLAIRVDTKQTQMMLYMLGKAHSTRNIRPWQYSIFVQTLLLTISSQLGTNATNEVMEAWVNLFAFVMRSMLPAAIRGQVVETEININTSSEFDAGRVAEEVAELEEAKAVNKRMQKASRSNMTSKVQTARGSDDGHQERS